MWRTLCWGHVVRHRSLGTLRTLSGAHDSLGLRVLQGDVSKEGQRRVGP
jgi:hypothetical protein